MNKIRCAIYTRKSSEEGLEQDFNSLHAQREACSAYILSQASEGWSLQPGEYDDGGLSGGTLERPALKRLLADIAAGKIDIVVVYKVDRLTRSLLDFSKLVEAMDKAGTSFVSVTQSFNTTTSMGRLTLNMLLSFAQFEREVTAERIRDKIAASKAKGMWMGGTPPLGYAPDGRTLRIVEEHSELIRDIFCRYLRTGNVRLVKDQLDEEGITVPERSTSTGRSMGGVPFTRGQIYKILANPMYLGEIHHKGTVYDGLHAAIIQRDMWEYAQAKLSEHQQGTQRAITVRSPSLLAGRVFDEAGEPLVATHACKGTVRYRYYVSRSLQHEPKNKANGWRIPAMELEKAVLEHLVTELAEPLTLLDRLGVQPSPAQLEALAHDAVNVAARLGKRERLLTRKLIVRVSVGAAGVEVDFSPNELARTLGLDVELRGSQPLSLSFPITLTRCGRAVRLIQQDGRPVGPAEPQEHMIKLLHRARSWWGEMTDHGLSCRALAWEHGVTTSYVSRVIRLNFLAPDIVEAIIAGTQPVHLDAKTLLGMHEMPLGWTEQKRQLRID